MSGPASRLAESGSSEAHHARTAEVSKLAPGGVSGGSSHRNADRQRARRLRPPRGATISAGTRPGAAAPGRYGRRATRHLLAGPRRGRGGVGRGRGLAEAPANTGDDVWFTGAIGILTELFYPNLDTPDFTDQQFIVGDSAHTWDQTERADATRSVTMANANALAWTVPNIGSNGKWQISKTIYTYPSSL